MYEDIYELYARPPIPERIRSTLYDSAKIKQLVRLPSMFATAVSSDRTLARASPVVPTDPALVVRDRVALSIREKLQDPLGCTTSAGRRANE